VRTVTPTLAAVAASITPTVQTAPPGGATYEVQSGDTLFGLSRRFGVSVADLASLNRMPADGGLRAGQDFQLPPGVWSNQLNIRVTRPARGAAVGSPVLVEGTASTFESVVQVEILAADGTRLAQASTRANAPDTGRHGPFQVSLPVAGAPDGRSATVRVFWSSPRDGAPLDEVRIPISLSG
jgi:LysM repeat protein